MRASFIPSREQRDLRELTRHRSSLAAKRGQAANELQKALESANIKLQSVVSDITGVSSTEMLAEMLAGKKNPKELAQLAKRRLRAKIPELEKALSGNRSLRSALVEAAHGAVRKKGSYYGAQFRRIAAHRGKKKALIAVAHSMAIALYHILKDKTSYRELGADFFDKLNPSRLLNRLTQRIQNLGFQVQLQPMPVTA